MGNQGIVATGDPNATINLVPNYWGTTVPTQIQAKILDHSTDPTRPTVNFQPYVSYTSSTVASAASAVASPSNQTLTLSATVTDSGGITVNEGTETFTILNGTQVVGQTTTPSNVVNGAVSATYTLPGGTLPGQYIIEASYSGSGSDYLPSTDTSHFLTVSPQVPAKVAFSQQPSNAVAGALISPSVVVQVEDASGNAVIGNSSTVTLTLSSQSFAGGSRTATAVASNGVATFSGLKIDITGNYTLSATDGALTPSGPSNGFTISPAAASQLVFQIPPYQTVTAGTPLTDPIVIYEEDSFNNIVTSDNSTVVTASLASGAGTLYGTKTATVSGGIASFNDLEDDTAGPLALQFAAGNLTPQVSAPSTVTPAPASSLAIKRPPSGVIAGSAFPLEVDAQDPYGNLATSFNGAVTVAAPSGPGTLSGTLTMTAKNGVAQFTNLIDTGGGPISLAASSGTLTSGDSSGATVTISPAAVSSFVVAISLSSPDVTGTTGTVTVTAVDQYGNPVGAGTNQYRGTVNLASSDKQVLGLPASYTFVAGDDGSHTFTNVALETVGSQTITATDSVNTTITGTSNTVEVIPIPLPPTISPLVVDYTYKMKKGKRVGKGTFAGYTIDYSTAMNQGSIGNHNNYEVDIFVLPKKGKKKGKTPEQIGFTVINVTSNSVTLKLTGKQTFPNGGEITVIGSAGGVESTSGVPLKTNEVFTLAKGGLKSSAPSP